jgi:AcrR family transcriptional regulator
MPIVKVNRSDWLDAALTLLAERGYNQVTVQALAVRLGVTRGSFYWHFADRSMMLREALAHWEQLGTDTLIRDGRRVSDVETRFGQIVRRALTDDPFPGLEPAIRAASTEVGVTPVLERVTRRRIEYLEGILLDAGLTPHEARQRATTVYATYVGWSDLRRTVPDILTGIDLEDVISQVTSSALSPRTR